MTKEISCITIIQKTITDVLRDMEIDTINLICINKRIIRRILKMKVDVAREIITKNNTGIKWMIIISEETFTNINLRSQNQLKISRII